MSKLRHPRGPAAPPAEPALLALDTSTGVGSVAVGRGGRLLGELLLEVGTGHSAMLLPGIDRLLADLGIERTALAGVVVGGGPGSFTGLRIAAATAKGIVHALRLPLWSYSGLLATAAASWSAERPVCALFDARRREVFAACYRFGAAVEELLPPTALPLDELLARFREGGAVPIFTGEAALLHREEIARELGALVAPAHLALPRASALLWLQQVAPALGAVAQPATWEPEYVRASGAERIAAQRAATPPRA